MNILVTGAAGLTGSYLVNKLLAEGYNTTGIDNFFRDVRRNIEEIKNHKNFNFIEDDILNIFEIEAGRIDVVFHLAAIVPTKYFYEAPVDTFMTNVYGTKIMLDWSKEKGVKKFINASSSEIYGHPIDVPTNELTKSTFDSVETTTRWSYAQGKLLTEHLTNAYGNYFNVCNLRYANVYGPGDLDEEHIIPYVILRTLKGKEIFLHENANNTYRTFLYMSDCANATFNAMRFAKNRECYNIGSSEVISILDSVKFIFDIIGKNVKINYIPERIGDPKRRLLDTTKARKILHFRTEIPFEEGLKKTIEWAKKLIQ